MLRAHKIRLNPSSEQANHFARACGTARFAYNWGLQEWNSRYEAGEKPNWRKVRDQLNAVKGVEYPWMKEVGKFPSEVAIAHLGKAFDRYLNHTSARPTFKKKGRSRESYYAADKDSFRCDGKRIRLPIIGWVNMRQSLRFDGKPKSATVSRVAGRWFVSILVEIPDPIPESDKNHVRVGVDLGILRMATCSDGATHDNPMPLRSYLKRLRRAQRRVSRRAKGSSNRMKAKDRLSQVYYRVSCIRTDALHKATAEIIGSAGIIVLEDLNVRGMMANHCLARSISDVGMGEFRRQILYKAECKAVVIVADRFYPSSKRCSCCGHIIESLPLEVREWECPVCHAKHDRDMNAATNLRDYPDLKESDWKSTARLAEIHACGDRSSGTPLRGDPQPVGEAGRPRNPAWTSTPDSE
jgi:putative transposase